MKQILLTIVYLFLSLQVQSAIVTGGVEYNYENKAEQGVDFEFIRVHLIDSNNIENLNYLYQGKVDLKDRTLAKFSDGSYGIVFKDDPLYSWYYSQNGRLINFTQKSSETYPCKITKYKPDGTVANTGKKISARESYIYKDGKLIAHWIGNNCYDRNNNLIMTRKYEE